MLAIPIVALLWCGLTYPLFVTALLTLLFCFWTLLALSVGLISVYSQLASWENLMSLRFSISMIALAPLMNAIMTHNRLQKIDKLSFLASHDSLTGALNRGGFYRVLHQSIRHRTPASYALLMIDLDHFKAINDRYGHAAGDEVLRVFVNEVHSILGGRGILGRLGGEEFAVYLRDMDTATYREMAEEIRQTLAEVAVEWESGARIQFTVSIGLLCRSESGDIVGDLELMSKQADSALYQAKTEGRNRVVEAISG